MRGNYRGDTFVASYNGYRHSNYGHKEPGRGDLGDGLSVGFMPWGWGCSEQGDIDGDGASGDDLGDGDGPSSSG